MDKLLITGITGSFGQAYLRWGAWQGRIYGLSRDEQKQDLLRQMDLPELRLILGDVRDSAKLRMAFRDVHTIIHTAALKIIPQGGYNPDEVIATNAIGTLNVLREAIHAGVKRVLLVSTDKSVCPTTLYGATKMLGEHLCHQLNDWSDSAISAVRYGNVIDSRGSFTHTLEAWRPGDAPLTITDERCTRFWITKRRAVEFVDFALDKMRGGEIFVPKLPARRLIDMLPQNAVWRVVGLRGTEKIHETLVGEHELPHTDEYPSHFVIRYHPYKGSTTRRTAYTSDPTQTDADTPDDSSTGGVEAAAEEVPAPINPS